MREELNSLLRTMIYKEKRHPYKICIWMPFSCLFLLKYDFFVHLREK